MAAKVSMKDVVTESTGKVEPLPTNGEVEKLTEQEWLEEITEKTERASCEPTVLFAIGQYHFFRENYTEALKYFEMAAGVVQGEDVDSRRAGAFKPSSQAKYQLGVMYYDGLGVQENSVKGSALMLEVAQSEDKKDSNIVPSAQYNIGRAYFMGFGVRQSDSQAEMWWSKAASHGSDPSSIRARHTLGLYYSREESSSLAQSYKFHLDAAKDGNAESMAAVGVMLIQGQGCDKDEEEGMQWLKESSKNGCVYGEGLLSRQYLARKLYSKACEAAFRVSDIEDQQPLEGDGDNATSSLSRLDCIGIATGCFVLARCMQLGNGIEKDVDSAMTLFKKAKSFDRTVTIELHDQLTMEQI